MWTYELLDVWLAPPETLHNPQPALAATAEADCDVEVSERSDLAEALHEIYQSQSL